jgi:hypothetical protein
MFLLIKWKNVIRFNSPVEVILGKLQKYVAFLCLLIRANLLSKNLEYKYLLSKNLEYKYDAGVS